jgi:S-DNA-T family DNA segregation ATPase FtsK/SpoIIIE
VITGMIKANFPTRIAFRVAQRVDSRTILDAQGAEYLLGKGDMLVSLNGSNGLRRIQCPFVSEEEVDAVTAFLRAQGEPVFDESILANRDGDGGDDEEEEALNPKDQEIYDRCVEMVRENQKCSTSWLQRKMGLGYNKAARFVDRMERTGVVGPPMGAGKDREVLG